MRKGTALGMPSGRCKVPLTPQERKALAWMPFEWAKLHCNSGDSSVACKSYVLMSYVTGETEGSHHCLPRSLGDQSLLNHLLSTACSGLVSLPSFSSLWATP